MRPSDRDGGEEAEETRHSSPPSSPPSSSPSSSPPGAGAGHDQRSTAVLDESWDPSDDTDRTDRPVTGDWDWKARVTWGQRAVAAFPVAAVVASAVLLVVGTAAAPGAAPPAVLAGTGGARLVTEPGAPVPTDTNAPGGAASYGVVTFTTPSGPSHPLQGSTSLALPPYLGWEANGSARPTNGYAMATGGLLRVGMHRATPAFRGWFLTSIGSVPRSCAFQFDAASPPPVPTSTGGGSDARRRPAGGPVGELVMAVQTSDTVTTGDIDYVVVAEVVHADGRRVLQVGYSTGHVVNAVEHLLKRVPWRAGPLQVSIATNGDNQLTVFVNGSLFLEASDLHMGIQPPFQPYLEVQELATPYEVAFSRYASVCGDDVAVTGLPDGTRAELGPQLVVAHGGRAVFARNRLEGPLTGPLTLAVPSTSGGHGPTVLHFPSHTFWPGDRFHFEPGP